MPRGRLNPDGPSLTKVSNDLAPAVQLTPLEWKFVENYLLTANPGEAARLSGIKQWDDGFRYLKRPAVQRAVDQAIAFRSSRTALKVDQVVYQLALIAGADVNELVSLKVYNCRFCWGDDGRYQYTPEEWRRARQKHYFAQLRKDKKDRREFDDEGGYGFRLTREPNPECTECCGLGVPRAVFKDTENLGPAGRAIFDGVKITKDGTIEVKTVPKLPAISLLGKHLGMFREREPVKEFDPAKMAEEDLDAVIDNLPPVLRDQVQALFENMAQDPRMAQEAGLAAMTDDEPEPPRRRQRVILDD